MNWLKFSLIALMISCHDECFVSGQLNTNLLPGGQLNTSPGNVPNFLTQLFQQPLNTRLSFNPFRSVSHNIGYNLGQTFGRTPSAAAQSLDTQPEASKVVLVLANDTPVTSALPQPDEETLKRLVRNPDFFQELLTRMESINEQLTTHVPAITRTFGQGVNEALSQAPILGQAQQSGAIDYARLGEAFGETILPQNMLAGMGEALNMTSSANNATDSETLNETEPLGVDLSPEPAPESPPPSQEPQAPAQAPQGSPFGSLLGENPLFRSFQQFVPPQLPPASADGIPFSFPWLQQAGSQGAASDISEVRVKPDTPNPYRISPKEADMTQKINEMKLRAAMKDALTKKTIPILWFRIPDKKEDSARRPVASNRESAVDEDLKMQLKLEAFEKQLIDELHQLQEVVKLANAMKKAQLESREKTRSEINEANLKPLTLNETPIYKITLADIERTLKDEYVQKLLQMAAQSRKKEKEQKNKALFNKYPSESVNNPNKRQTSAGDTGLATLDRDDLMKMMLYAYRTAALQGDNTSWLKENANNSNNMAMTSDRGMQQRMPGQPEMSDEQKWMMEKKQQQAAMEMNRAREMDEEKKLKELTDHSHDSQHQHHNHHHLTGHPAGFGHPPTSGATARNEGQNMQMPNNSPTMMMASQDQMRHGGDKMSEDMQNSWMSDGKTSDQQMRSGGSMQEQNMRQGASWMPNENEKQFQGQQGPKQRFGEAPNAGGEMTMAQWAEMVNSPNMQMRQQQWSPATEQNRANQKTNPHIPLQRQMFSSSKGDTPMSPEEKKIKEQQQRYMLNVAQQAIMSMINDARIQESAGKETERAQTTSADDRKTETSSPSSSSFMTKDGHQMTSEQRSGAQLPIGAQAMPQMPENAGKARHKVVDDFLEEFVGQPRHHDDKSKAKHTGAVVNYYYNAAAVPSRYPPAYAPAAPPSYNYGAGAGGGYASSYGGASSGYYAPPRPTPATPSYTASQYYGGGGYGSNAYGSGGAYRTAVGDAEIEEMLKEHQTLPRMMLLIRPEDPQRFQTPPATTTTTDTTKTNTTLDATKTNNGADLSNQTKSSATLNPSETATTSETSLSSSQPPSSSDSLSASSYLHSSSSNPQYQNLETDEERVGYDPILLEPFMGLQSVDRQDDPWRHKPYNLYQPIFTGGGTFEALLNRYRRSAAKRPELPHVLTPSMLERLLRIKVNFEKNYPFLYKTMMGHMTGDKHTTLSITPPEIPKHVSYPNVELAAAEINQMENLLRELKTEKYNRQQEQPATLQTKPDPEEPSTRDQQQPEQTWPNSQEYLDNFVNEDNSFWYNLEKRPNPLESKETPSLQENNYWNQFQDPKETNSALRKRESFWQALEDAEERQSSAKYERQIADDLDRIFNFDEDDTN
ncbi:defective chorion protein, FC125 isoform isoform X2 [Musca domestica]|uniref:Defective chorion protein, FC125 isoform isoform X2 n=1 Tax=Musca domestica TaxID=7370 RepID=A0A1I8MEM2_MUSDO|nr:defective chorion protein, FC125 isoform isoform X2 [Musca domestica]